MVGSDSRGMSSLDAVMHAHPELTSFGIGVFASRTKSADQRRTELAERRSELREREEAVLKIAVWLQANIAPIKTPSIGSYKMKHVAERALGEYVSNGELIAAALIAGYPVKYSGGPNASLGMSKRDVDVIEGSRRSG